MSRAFVKEPDGAEVFEELPERPVSPHPNLVTQEGRLAIEAEISGLQVELAAAKAGADRGRIVRAMRDLRYWTARRASAQVVARPENPERVQFGVRVDILREDGRRQAYRIVGEDEADPAAGSISHVSPLARALFGKEVGDTAKIAGGEVEIVDIA